MEWLFQLYRGYDSELATRTRKGTYPEINNLGMVNYYSLIADYASNLFMQKPIMYINVDGDEETSKLLQEYIKENRLSHKNTRDKTIASHAAVVGVAWRFIEMGNNTLIKDSVLNPKNVFALYGDDTDDEAMAKVYITKVRQLKDSPVAVAADNTQESGLNNYTLAKRYTVYTDTHSFSFVEGSQEVEVKPLLFGSQIIEYKMNPYYIGSFERVVSLIQMLAILRSDGVNAVVQHASGVMFFKNIGIPMDKIDDTEEEKEFKAKLRAQTRQGIKEFGQIWADDSKEMPASIQYIASELYNADIEVLVDGIIKDIITISRTPNSVVNLGASGNAGAAETASGMTQALENAANAEPYWFESARNQAKIELAIAHYKGRLIGLEAGDFDFAIQREVIADIVGSSTAYATYRATGMSYGEAARLSNITADPESFEERQLKWREEERKRGELDVENEKRTQQGYSSLVQAGIGKVGSEV